MLFKDTYAYDHWDFEQTNPVIQLDLSKVNGDRPEVVSDKLLEIIIDAAELLDIELKETRYPDVALNKLILKAGKITPVVILIDEYDTPILDNLNHPKLDAIKQILRSFYKIIKANEAFIRFVYITGNFKVYPCRGFQCPKQP